MLQCHAGGGRGGAGGVREGFRRRNRRARVGFAGWQQHCPSDRGGGPSTARCCRRRRRNLDGNVGGIQIPPQYRPGAVHHLHSAARFQSTTGPGGERYHAGGPDAVRGGIHLVHAHGQHPPEQRCPGCREGGGRRWVWGRLPGRGGSQRQGQPPQEQEERQEEGGEGCQQERAGGPRGHPTIDSGGRTIPCPEGGARALSGEEWRGHSARACSQAL
mmetsp:Transcript_21686/g.62204  ORF Transcript_21686/g.62204 Transcript_21686/m.62204 type:complete len:216 (+) Transcript_21686:472-1119(+)